jgi:hypothetical protein
VLSFGKFRNACLPEMRSLVKDQRKSSIHARLQNQKTVRKKESKRRPCQKSCNAESIVQEKVMVNIGYHRRIA